MTVEVRLFATLARYLPSPERSGAATLDVPEGSTVDDLARCLGIPEALDRLALVNGQEAEPAHVLRPGDVVEMFPPLAGGLTPS